MSISATLCYFLNRNFDKLQRIRPIYHNADLSKIESPTGIQELEFSRGPLEWTFYNKFLPSIENKTLLDVGCGFGGRSVHYALMGATVTGIDNNPSRFKSAGIFAKQKGVENKVKFQVADAADLPFGANSFDIVMSNNAMQYIANPLKGLKEMKRVARPQGLICINFGPPWRAPMCPDIGATFPWTHLLFSQDAIKKAYARLGRGNTFKGREDDIYKYTNKLTIRSYRRLLQEARLNLLYFDTWTRPYVAPLLHVPVIKEYFCAQIISVAKK